MNKCTVALTQSLLLAAFFAVPSLAAEDEALKKDLTAVIALQGFPCGEVVSVKTQAENDKAAAEFQKTILEESPVVVTILSPVTAAHTTKVKGIETITVPYGPNLNTVYMTKS